MAVVVLALAAASPAVAADEFVWSAETGADNTSATLWYGVRESDAMQFLATCTTSGAAGDDLLMATFGSDVKGKKEGASTIVDVAIGGSRSTFKGKIVGVNAEEGLSGARVPIKLDDAKFWSSMESGGSLSYAIRGSAKLRMSLEGASDAVQKFIADCNSIASTGMVAGASGAAPAGGNEQMPDEGSEGAGDEGLVAGTVAGTKITYSCDEGIDMTVVYTQNGEESTATVTHDVSGTVTLPRAISGSGARYSNGEFELFTKGPEATFSWKDGQHKCLEN